MAALPGRQGSKEPRYAALTERPSEARATLAILLCVQGVEDALQEKPIVFQTRERLWRIFAFVFATGYFRYPESEISVHSCRP